ncbi:MAG: PrsW family glutamic-type intramembrane protease [Deltaproteobacteria bacterium]
MPELPREKVVYALLLLALAESPVALQLLHLDRSYLFFAFGLAWAVAFYWLAQPGRRGVWLGLFVYLLTAATAVPLLVLWLNLRAHLLHQPIERTFTEPLEQRLVGSFGVGVREELCKTATLALAVLLGSRLRPRITPREGIVCGAMSGLAFAAVENLETFHSLCRVGDVKLAHGLDAGIAWTVAAALGRLVSTPLAHACWSGVIGFALTYEARGPLRRARNALLAILCCAGLHGLYDTCAALGNRFGVAVLLAVSFGLLLYVLARREPPPEPLPAGALLALAPGEPEAM